MLKGRDSGAGRSPSMQTLAIRILRTLKVGAASTISHLCLSDQHLMKIILTGASLTD